MLRLEASKQHILMLAFTEKRIQHRPQEKGISQNQVHEKALAGSLSLSCIRPQLTAAVLLLGPRSDDGNRK